MPESRKFAVSCETFGAVELETQEWTIQRDGENVQIHYNAMCRCGKEHFGCTLPLVELVVYREVAEELEQFAGSQCGQKGICALALVSQAKRRFRVRCRWTYRKSFALIRITSALAVQQKSR